MGTSHSMTLPVQLHPNSDHQQNVNISPTRRYTISQREPWVVPDMNLELPGPGQAPVQPPSINLLSTLLPPILMVVGMVLLPLLTGSSSLWAVIPMLLMGLGFPLASLLGLSSQKKKYQQALVDRETTYRNVLEREQQKLNGYLQEQRAVLEREYPSASAVVSIALNRANRLWWRRAMDNDFLSLRIGTGQGVPSFKVNPPRVVDPNDPLNTLSFGIADQYRSNPSIPLLLNLAKIGSVAITARTSASVYDLTRRLVLDILVHHSPQDVNLSILANTRDAEQRWEWLKWAPHTAALVPEEKPRRICFSDEQIDNYLKWLVDEFNSRTKLDAGYSAGSKRKSARASLVVLLDDNGIARQLPEICRIAEFGYEVGIFLIFVGGQNWPRECRSRIELAGVGFKYVETWDTSGLSNQSEGSIESLPLESCERVARSLAGLEVTGSQSMAQLPESIRLSAVLGPTSLEVESIKKSWSRQLHPSDLLQFPIGVCANRDQLDLVTMSLLPEPYGGVDAYHTVLIGTTGSGKSEFMKSMVMGAALRYPPDLLNFFFLDFKGGVTFNVFKDFPHVLGVVSDLNGDLVNRGIESIKNEFDRRSRLFSNPQVKDIWEYNQMHMNKPLNHLVLLLDEFTKGLSEFPELRPTLDQLVRQGRSLGMYLILANQDANSEVDKLLDNVGWRIALKVAKEEQISMIDRSLMSEPHKLPKRAGEGYLRSIKGVITRFQAGYAGFPVMTQSTQDVNEFTLYTVEKNGTFLKLYKNQNVVPQGSGDKSHNRILEEEKIIMNLKEATAELGIKPVSRIYLDPLPEKINLQEVIHDSVINEKFIDGEWISSSPTCDQMIAPIGYYDAPSECVQEILELDFNQQDGNLWLVGAPGSGKESVLTAIILSLAVTHTPEEIHFYILEFGDGTLRSLDSLPHTGSVIRLQEKEKIQRLLNYLDEEMDHRSSRETMLDVNLHSQGQIFVIVNNYAEMYTNFPDEAMHLSRYVRDGKAAGIHVIISTNRGAELTRNIANNIARKLVLQLSSRDEYMDAIGRNVVPLSVRSEGRGYWVDERPLECQIGNFDNVDIKAFARAMDAGWKGKRPKQIGTIPACISLSDLLAMTTSEKKQSSSLLPIGISYETLDVVKPDLEKEMTQWLIMGPRESGKSNFLACTVKTLLEKPQGNWRVFGLGLRRSPLAEVFSGSENCQFSRSSNMAMEMLNNLADRLKDEPESDAAQYMLIIDDLGAVLELGISDALNLSLNALLPVISSRRDVHLMAAGLIDELRNQIASPVVKLLRQSRTGIAFSKDTSELDWLGAPIIPLEYRKLEMPVGRGFFVSKGKLTLVQTPFNGECHTK